MALTQILSPLANLVAFYDFIQPGDGAHNILHVLCIWPIFLARRLNGRGGDDDEEAQCEDVILLPCAGLPDAVCPITQTPFVELELPVGFRKYPSVPYECTALAKWLRIAGVIPHTNEPCSLRDANLAAVLAPFDVTGGADISDDERSQKKTARRAAFREIFAQKMNEDEKVLRPCCGYCSPGDALEIQLDCDGLIMSMQVSLLRYTLLQLR